MTNQFWSSAGSAGTVNIPDIGKVVFDNSIVQLQGIDLVFSQSAPLAALPVVQTQAVIRYGVTPVEGVLSQALGLKLRYRDGSGRVTAVLIQVDIATGAENHTVATFDSDGFTRSNAFQVHGPGLGTVLDFSNSAYYVELRLTGFAHPPMPMLFPPKVSVIQLVTGQFE